ncbi:myb/SANT-like DNA-binding domain-containing protein 3 [Anneissia japonica]|uniref:myb/SANT-like DNA-binding domain-containing protein 3 n=1 Tax=Anneissia japonica TaxID=1529436 RepID=UPI001425743C|nr:myb/SANT-like DNA-binding domain-containing protein 3 [Anneissia japonica]
MDPTLKCDPRRNAFTLMEKEYLVDLVEEHKQILDPLIRYNDSMTVFKRKQSWKLIEKRYNDKFKENPRDIDQLKRMWSKIKVQVKKHMNVARNEDNVWTLARAMFHKHVRNVRDDSQKKDVNLESIVAQISARKDLVSSHTESETNGSQHENSTPHTNVSSDDDLIVLNVTENRSKPPANKAGQSNPEVVLNSEPVANAIIPVTYPTASQDKNNYVCTQQGEAVPTDRTPNQFSNTNYQNTVECNGINTDNYQSQQIPSTDHLTPFEYCHDLSTSKSLENTGEYSLWHNIHSLDDRLTQEDSLSDTRGANIRNKISRRRPHGLGTDCYISRGRVTKARRDGYRHRFLKRNGNRLMQNDIRIGKRLSQREEDERYEEGEGDNQLKEKDFLSESSYRKRVLELAEEEHAEKMRVLKLKCEVLELQKRELESKLQK